MSGGALRPPGAASRKRRQKITLAPGQRTLRGTSSGDVHFDKCSGSVTEARKNSQLGAAIEVIGGSLQSTLHHPLVCRRFAAAMNYPHPLRAAMIGAWGCINMTCTALFWSLMTLRSYRMLLPNVNLKHEIAKSASLVKPEIAKTSFANQ